MTSYILLYASLWALQFQETSDPRPGTGVVGVNCPHISASAIV